MMFDGFTDFAIRYCDNPGYPSKRRLIGQLIVAYLLVTVLFVTESNYRKHGIELEATVETIGETRLAGKRAETGMLVRCHFRDPITNQPRMNTVAVPKHLVPRGPTALIEYIPGEFPTSRLKVQQRPIVFSVYFWVNAAFFTALVGSIGFIAWEAHQPIPRSSERRVVMKQRM